MGCIIDKMMLWFDVTSKRLQAEKEIIISTGQKLYWDDYCYVKRKCD